MAKAGSGNTTEGESDDDKEKEGSDSSGPLDVVAVLNKTTNGWTFSISTTNSN